MPKYGKRNMLESINQSCFVHPRLKYIEMKCAGRIREITPSSNISHVDSNRRITVYAYSSIWALAGQVQLAENMSNTCLAVGCSIPDEIKILCCWFVLVHSFSPPLLLWIVHYDIDLFESTSNFFCNPGNLSATNRKQKARRGISSEGVSTKNRFHRRPTLSPGPLQ